MADSMEGNGFIVSVLLDKKEELMVGVAKALEKTKGEENMKLVGKLWTKLDQVRKALKVCSYLDLMSGREAVDQYRTTATQKRARRTFHRSVASLRA